jgi:hypothetical protein
MAMLTVEKQDHAATQKALDETAAYWRAWCGKHLGCDLAVPPKAGQ